MDVILIRNLLVAADISSIARRTPPGPRRTAFRMLACTGSLLFVIGFFTSCAVRPSDTPSSILMVTASPFSSPSPESTQPELTQPPVPTEELPSSSPTSVPLQPSPTQPAMPSPACSSPAALTPALTEGPYFKAGSPERSSLLETDTPGIQLILTGYVLTSDCQPVSGALLDFWQADANGQYDNAGYNLRGHQYSDANGYYQLTTVVPGIYPGRTEHIHFKVQAPGGPILTSQLFFPGVSENEGDRIFDEDLVINITRESETTVEARFNFIVKP